MGRKSKFKINEVIEMHVNEKSADRIERLRGLLDEELKSDKPSMRYIEDLQESIKYEEGKLK